MYSNTGHPGGHDLHSRMYLVDQELEIEAPKMKRRTSSVLSRESAFGSGEDPRHSCHDSPGRKPSSSSATDTGTPNLPWKWRRMRREWCGSSLGGVSFEMILYTLEWDCRDRQRLRGALSTVWIMYGDGLLVPKVANDRIGEYIEGATQ